MAWYKAGTITVTGGSAAIVGAGTAFVENVKAGDLLRGPDERIYEIGSVNSDTSITLARNYAGSTASGQNYAIAPLGDQLAVLAKNVAELIQDYQDVADNAGTGMFGDGTVGTPGIRFASDQDTGIRRLPSNIMALVVGGVDRVILTQAGINVAGAIDVESGGRIGYIPNNDTFDLAGTVAANYGLTVGSSFGGGNVKTLLSGYGGVIFATQGAERARIDQSGNLLIGTTVGAAHTIQRSVAAGAAIASFRGDNYASASLYSTGGTGLSQSSADCVLGLLGLTSTGRSINAGGTINASGADYAEYMTKTEGCGTIAKGDVCGVDRDGKLVTAWASAHSFVVKSTDPAYVGGDSWAQDIGPKPEAPAEDASEAEQAQHEAALAAWEAEIETARQTVDRIAFSGQVPVNVGPATLAQIETAIADSVGIYLVAQQAGAGISAAAVLESEMTLPAYMKRLGKVWAVRDGRPWIDVQHG